MQSVLHMCKCAALCCAVLCCAVVRCAFCDDGPTASELCSDHANDSLLHSQSSVLPSLISSTPAYGSPTTSPPRPQSTRPLSGGLGRSLHILPQSTHKLAFLRRTLILRVHSALLPHFIPNASFLVSTRELALPSSSSSTITPYTTGLPAHPLNHPDAVSDKEAAPQRQPALHQRRECLTLPLLLGCLRLDAAFRAPIVTTHLQQRPLQPSRSHHRSARLVETRRPPLPPEPLQAFCHRTPQQAAFDRADPATWIHQATLFLFRFPSALITGQFERTGWSSDATQFR